MDYFKRPIGQDRPLKEARKNQKNNKKRENKSWGKACSKVENYLGGKRSTAACLILKNLRKNENVRQCFNPIPIDKL